MVKEKTTALERAKKATAKAKGRATSLLRTSLVGDNGEGEDDGFGAGEEGDGEGEGESDQSGWILVAVPPATRLDPRGLDPLDHHPEGSRRPGQ